MAGVLDYSPSMSTNLNVDTTGKYFCGTINGRIKVYVDPYESLETGLETGMSPRVSWLFFMMQDCSITIRSIANGSCDWKNDFRRIAFKTRYGMARIHLIVHQSQQTLMLV